MQIKFKLSEKAIQHELREGNEVRVNQKIDIKMSDLTQQERDFLVSRCFVTETYINISFTDLNSLDWRKEILLIDKEKKIREAKQKKEKDEKKTMMERLEKIKEETGYFISLGYINSISFSSEGSRKSFTLENERERCTSINNGLVKEIALFEDYMKTESEKIEKKEKKEKDRKEKKLKLHTWAKKNGSDFLKLRIKHDQNWYKVANNEYVKSVALGGFSTILLLESKLEFEYAIENASLENLQEMDGLKLPKNASNLHLEYYSTNNEYGYRKCKYIVYDQISLSGDTIELLREVE